MPQQQQLYHQPQQQLSEKGPHAYSVDPLPAPQPIADPAARAVHPGPVQHQPSHFGNATPIAALGQTPAPIDCPACRQRAMTRTQYETGGFTWLIAALVCIPCHLGCCLIPFLTNGCKDVNHFCGACGCQVARWHRSGRTEQLVHG